MQVLRDFFIWLQEAANYNGLLFMDDPWEISEANCSKAFALI